ncbi:MAG: DUF1979 domain-containing protein [Desulfobacteraceae bacterium]|nr:MAG: DUF1979 domain-containing protein [Desulfobacteraceae bacterium]
MDIAAQHGRGGQLLGFNDGIVGNIRCGQHVVDVAVHEIAGRGEDRAADRVVPRRTVSAAAAAPRRHEDAGH